MCGIVGSIDWTGPASDLESVRRAIDSLYNRGPDDAGTWREENIALGHRRLSILDLSSAGHQPMISADGRYVIVHNGEIYNFRQLREELSPYGHSWHSESDTEMILSAYATWGPACVEHFHGMFAFSIWDRVAKTLYAARDRMGVKPYYYHHSTRRFVFGSRPRALFRICEELSRTYDNQALRLYLESGYIPAPHSIYASLKKLPPAHYLVVNSNGIRISRYWDFRHIPPDSSWTHRDEEQLLDELEEILTESVRLRLTSDVPVGAFLSGGVDSSLLVALMQKSTSTKVKTFTIGFDDKTFDESKHAAAVSRHLGTEHHCENLKANDLLDMMPDFLREFDEPFFDSSAFPTMAISRMTKRHVSVSLSGDGADELFGGYHYYEIARYLNSLYGLPPAARNGVASVLRMVPGRRSKLLSEALRLGGTAEAFAYSRSIAKSLAGILNHDVLDGTDSIQDLFGRAANAFPNGLHASEEGMRLDAFYTLSDDFLQKVDVASMAFSLESREPYLDQTLIEWAMKLPLNWKLRRGGKKYLLRKLCYRYVPRSLIDRPKMGFGAPIGKWLRGPLNQWANEVLADRAFYSTIPVNQKAVSELLTTHRAGSNSSETLLWAILMLSSFVSRTA